MLEGVLAYINYHLEEEISLDHLSEITGYSSFHLHRKLKESLNEPIGNFIIRQRIQKAGYLLTLTTLPVSEIGALVGYENDSAFGRAFKKVYNVSPTQYRQINNKKEVPALYEPYLSLKAELIKLPKQKAILFPTLTNYFTKDSFRVWENVASFIKENELNEQDFQYYGILHDCQNVNEESLLRYDAALICKKELRLPVSKYFISELPSGKFLKYKFCSPVSQYKNIGHQVNTHLSEEKGHVHNHGASYFKFQHLPEYKNADHLLIEWFIPIK